MVRYYLSVIIVYLLFLTTVNVLNFRTLVAFQNCLDKQARPNVLLVCYSDKHFVKCSPENLHFI